MSGGGKVCDTCGRELALRRFVNNDEPGLNVSTTCDECRRGIWSRTRGKGKVKDLRGARFGRLLVATRAERPERAAYWRCVCDCGNTCEVRSDHLSSGHTRSCGCLYDERGK